MTSSFIPRAALRVSTFRSPISTHTSRARVISQGQSIKNVSGLRFASSEVPASRPGTWRGMFLRWGLAAGIVYYYNTSPLFAEEPPLLPTRPPPAEASPTLESIAAARSKRSNPPTLDTKQSAPPTLDKKQVEEPVVTSDAATLEAEADSQGAFNPETGEINWDCPCLGGMAHGPCGEEFKAAFSCFVYSKEEPKGMECIDKFKGMQDCFRAHPDVYAEELAETEDDFEEGEVDVANGGKLPDASTDVQPAFAMQGDKESIIGSKQEERNNTEATKKVESENPK